MASALRVRYRIWLEDDKPVFGDGMASLLTAIDHTGSINQAAASLRMSYRQAWGRIRKAEERLGIKLVETRVGGESGGGATMTAEGREFLQKFGELKDRVDRSVHEIFEDTFRENP